MYCPDCGNTIDDKDSFCRFCGKFLSGTDLRDRSIKTDNDVEEIVLYTAKKHVIGLLWPIALSPFFITLFWNVYVATNTMFGTIFGIILIIPVIISVLKYCSEGMVITNKFIHIEHGIFNPSEINIPVKKSDMVWIKQTFLGGMCGYCDLVFDFKERRYKLTHLRDCDRLDAIFADMEKYIAAAMKDPELKSI